MFAGSLDSRVKRRGVVLVVVLGMLGLLALIGVTFATFSGQAQSSARNYVLASAFPDATELMDYALLQLIDDTGNPGSVIRGHSLKRDMYGHDAVNNGNLISGFWVSSATLMTSGTHAGTIQLVTNIPNRNNLPAGASYYNLNFTRWILRFPAGFNAPNSFIAKSHEILVDDNVNDPSWRIFYVAVPDMATGTNLNSNISTLIHQVPPADPTITGFQSATLSATGVEVPLALPLTGTTAGWTSQLNSLPIKVNFVLDGRYLRAFNGPGVSGIGGLKALDASAGVVTGLDNALMKNVDVTNLPGHPLTEYGNFRYNGAIFQNAVQAYTDYLGNGKATPTRTPTLEPFAGDPDNANFVPSMDEDYDAPDLENWFLAIQSADGQVVIPSFHRPGIVTLADWGNISYLDPDNSNNTAPLRRYDPTNTASGWTTFTPAQKWQTIRAMSRILRPRKADGHSAISFPDLLPDGGTRKINFDVDNDGDGTSDSVWLDLGYPPKRNAEGQSFKPLFAFMVIGLNGRLPLNTAGNLQKRDPTLHPLNDHTEHLGTSPSELDLRFALQNAYLPADVNGFYPYSQFDDAGGLGGQTAGPNPTGVGVGLTQLRNLLAGTRPWAPNITSFGDLNVVNMGPDGTGKYIPFNLPNGVGDQVDQNTPAFGVLRPTPPVAGRWGEEEFVPGVSSPSGANAVLPPPATGYSDWNNAIRAGVSVSGISFDGTGVKDARDDNSNTFDFNHENFDTYDSAGAIYLPVERIRRFVTPIDINGDGRVVTFNSTPNSGMSGADNWGRVAFQRFFRPPGIPTVSSTPPRHAPIPTSRPAPPYTVPAANTPAPIENALINSNNMSANTVATWYDSALSLNDTRSNNPYHGYFAAVTPADNVAGLNVAAMPSDSTTPTPQQITSTAVTVPTYTDAINSSSAYPSPGLNEADEMNLYVTSRVDAPFGAGDLEWLYRFQDRDGASLQSRLMYLAPVSFTNPQDGLRRRRLFSIDTWETTNFVWANDNPQGAFPTNSRFSPVADSSFASLNSSNYATTNNGAAQHLAINTLTNPPSLTSVNMTLSPDPAADFTVLANGFYQTSLAGANSPYPAGALATQNPVATPSLAHRDRKINLNFPLPVSNSPYEPVRQKWIRETYQLLKAILPPKAVDTPEELAQLSQYVVNIIDFRDPDAAMTRFVNTDIVVVEPTVPTTESTTALQTTLRFWNVTTDATDVHLKTPTGAAYDVTYTPTTVINDVAPNHYLVQYGMEYQPVALNEVMAFQFQTKKVAANNTPNAANSQSLMFVEIVNMLGKDQLPETATAPDSSNIDLTNWDFVVLPDDGMGRPDPYTGQIPLSQKNLLPTNSMAYTGGILDLPTTTHMGQPYVLSVPLAGGRVQDNNGNSGGASSGTSATTGNTLGAGASMAMGAGGTATAWSYMGLPNPPAALTKSSLPPSAATTATPDNPNDGSLTKPQQHYYVFGNGPISTTGTSAVDSSLLYTPDASGNAPASATNLPPVVGVSTNFVDLTGMLYQRKTTMTSFPDFQNLNPGYYYWLYLRRPANPFDTNPDAEKVVVDSFRFVFLQSQGQGQTNTMTNVDSYGVPGQTNGTGINPSITAPGIDEYIFSLQRMQPYRGGHAIPPMQATPGVAATIVNPANGDSFQTAYGYSEQTVPGPYVPPSGPTATTGPQNIYYFGKGTGGNPLQITGLICDTLGYPNFAKTGDLASGAPVATSMATLIGTQPDPRDYFVFNDRDFASVIELTLVPGCPPGLFTKQFAELPPPLLTTSTFAFTTNPVFYTLNTTTPASTGPLTTDKATWETVPHNVWARVNGWPTFYSNGPPHTFPYLNDEFFYTAASEPAGGAAWTQNELATGPVNSFRSQTPDNYTNFNYVGGPSGAGWFKMFDFFEVPTTAFGAIGPVGQGMNYDWARQDLKPGLLNINLIIDEEVFLGLMGESLYGSPYSQSTRSGVLSQSPTTNTPNIVTQAAEDGATVVPAQSYAMPNVGAFDYDLSTPPKPGNQMKACFSDFLNLRGGATGYLYGFGHAPTGSMTATPPSLDRELPYHSLSFPDITMTIMRPATLTPASPSPAYPWVPGNPAPLPDPTAFPSTTFTWDPGIKNPYYFTTSTSTAPLRQIYQPPPIPARRLFQIPDAWGGSDNSVKLVGPTISSATPAFITFPASNASIIGDVNYNTQSFPSSTTNQMQNKHGNLVREKDGLGNIDPTVNLGGQPYGMVAGPPVTWQVQPTTTGGSVAKSDQRDHPYFRTEWLQKVANLTTVRTHQYAVWITVGFFEITRTGDPQLALTRPDLAYDLFGLELGVLDNRNVRYRGFFVVDRTRAVGFNPNLPGDFRGCVTYRQLID